MIGRRGYVDPTLGPPQTAKERALFAAVRDRGLTLHRLHAGRPAVRIVGPDVHVTAANLGLLSLQDIDLAQLRNTTL